ncbi:MAG: MarR family winged helix-turn-helix transcriptional regulator [Ilumatobacter sp.]|uniref:MarR family winged helix-turn-helix transcriptional regulator n=1 Tax=Ilumatobacter sp. TaxID=1967498 RepID=UPI003299E389
MTRGIPRVAGDTPDELAPQVADLLHSVTHRLRREARATQGAHRATWTQMRALRALERLRPPVRMSALAEELHIARRSATSLVDDLESSGFVRRVRDPDDRRAVIVESTAAGRRVMIEAGERRRRATVGMLGTLSEAELRTLRDILGRLVE